VQRQLPQILSIERQDIEGVKLDFLVMLTGMQPMETEMPSTPSKVGLTIDDERGLTVL
jgi:hypothetical protein